MTFDGYIILLDYETVDSSMYVEEAQPPHRVARPAPISLGAPAIDPLELSLGVARSL